MLKVTLSRQVHFSSGHRYFNKDLSEAQNKEIFGACYSPHGHGHNYILEAEFSGPVDPQTGMIINLRDIDVKLKRVAAVFDHKFINEDVEEFTNKVPTTENLALSCFQRVCNEFSEDPVEVTRVRLYETKELWVDIEK